MPGPLTPYRVLDLSDEKGFYCGKMLGDLGADVILAEPPGGHPARNIGPFYQGIPHPERSLLWWSLNTSKRGITLGLETADGRALLRRLVERVDVVVECFPPGHMARLGLGFDDLVKINPRVILTSITPFGQTGPYAHYKGADIVGLAMGGLMYIIGDPDRPPVRARASQAYFCASLVAALATLLALHNREANSEAQWVDVAVQQSVTWFTPPTFENWDLEGVIIKRVGPGRPVGRFARRVIFPCKDGHVAIMGVLGREWPAFIGWMDSEGAAGELKDPKWAPLAERVARRDIPQAPNEETNYVHERIIPWLMTHTVQEIYEEGQRRNIAVFPVNTAKTLTENIQLQAREFWVPVEHPEVGRTITYPGAPYKYSATPWSIQRRAPLIGEHNLEVYEGELSLARSELTALKAAGAI
ncbi:MAG: CoA transferase [Chloroflexi bacterium]|nr:CoA transferase [Chloroflexota bacterium]